MVHDSSPGDPRHVVVGLSGGVDSAVAALLLQQAGYVVHGVALDTWRVSESDDDAVPSAQQVAAHLGIPLIRRDLKATFYENVVTPFLNAYSQGQTPNPCVFCNPKLKFASLLREADALGTRWIATGHYVRVTRTDDGVCHLLRGQATTKDQSYALYRLTQPTVQRLLLPLGDLESKEQVRYLARQHGIPNAETKDSQDLCFAVGTNYQALVSKLRPDAVTPGPIVDEAGHQLGKHHGLPLYTVGQRSGLGIASNERLYILRLNACNNTIVVGPRASLAEDHCTIQQVTFVTGLPPAQDFSAVARIRYRAPLVPVSVCLGENNTAEVHFSHPQYGVAPGQSLVLYQDEEVLGGGVIGMLSVP